MDTRTISNTAARSTLPPPPHSTSATDVLAFSQSSKSVFDVTGSRGAHQGTASERVSITQPDASSPTSGPPRLEVSLARYRAWQTAKCLVTALKWTIGLVSAIGLAAAGIVGGVILGGAGGVLTGSFMVTEMCVKGGFYAGASVFFGLDWLESKISEHLAGLVPRAESAASIAESFMLV